MSNKVKVYRQRDWPCNACGNSHRRVFSMPHLPPSRKMLGILDEAAKNEALVDVLDQLGNWAFNECEMVCKSCFKSITGRDPRWHELMVRVTPYSRKYPIGTCYPVRHLDEPLRSKFRKVKI